MSFSYAASSSSVNCVGSTRSTCIGPASSPPTAMRSLTLPSIRLNISANLAVSLVRIASNTKLRMSAWASWDCRGSWAFGILSASTACKISVSDSFRGRPFGLPDCPRFHRKAVILAGFPRGLAFPTTASSTSTLIERLLCAVQYGLATGKVLPALHGHIDIEGIDLDGQSHTPRCLRGDNRRARTHKGVVDRLSGIEMMQDRPTHTLDWFGCAVMVLGFFVGSRFDMPQRGLTVIAFPLGVGAFADEIQVGF